MLLLWLTYFFFLSSFFFRELVVFIQQKFLVIRKKNNTTMDEVWREKQWEALSYPSSTPRPACEIMCLILILSFGKRNKILGFHFYLNKWKVFSREFCCCIKKHFFFHPHTLYSIVYNCLNCSHFCLFTSWGKLNLFV